MSPLVSLHPDRTNEERWKLYEKWFLASAGILLVLTGGAKFYSAFGTAKGLYAADPLLGIPYGRMMMVTGLGEIGAGVLCLLTKARPYAGPLVAALASGFVLYRIGLWSIGWEGLCGCLGNLTGSLGLSAENADRILQALALYLLVGGYALLSWRGRSLISRRWSVTSRETHPRQRYQPRLTS